MPKAGVRLLYFSGSNIHAEGWGASLTLQRHSQDSTSMPKAGVRLLLSDYQESASMPKAGVPQSSAPLRIASMPKAGVPLQLFSDYQDRASMPEAGVRLPLLSDSQDSIHAEG